MAAAARTMTGREELERWCSLHLRPRVARAAERRVIEPMQAAAFELTMAAFVCPHRPIERGNQTRPKGARRNGQ
jgi:hypothetical protein